MRLTVGSIKLFEIMWILNVVLGHEGRQYILKYLFCLGYLLTSHGVFNGGKMTILQICSIDVRYLNFLTLISLGFDWSCQCHQEVFCHQKQNNRTLSTSTIPMTTSNRRSTPESLNWKWSTCRLSLGTISEFLQRDSHFTKQLGRRTDLSKC